MAKLIALLLILSMVLSFVACSKKNNGDEDIPSVPDTSTDGGGENTNNALTVAVPEYKDYGRGTVDFGKLVYSRPNIQYVIDGFVGATLAVEANETSVAEQIASIREMEIPYANVETMYSLAQIYNNKDFSIAYWQTEYEYISTNYPRLLKIVEDLLVACAQSEHRSVFESEYFGYSLEEYVNGGIYTDEVVALMEEEAALESEYASISTANVQITYEGVDSNMNWTGTVDDVIAKAREYFKYDDASYERCLLAIDILYAKARSDIEIPLFIDLIRVRRLIADELGHDSYSTLAYDGMGYDYSPSDMLALLGEIGDRIANDTLCHIVKHLITSIFVIFVYFFAAIVQIFTKFDARTVFSARLRKIRHKEHFIKSGHARLARRVAFDGGKNIVVHNIAPEIFQREHCARILMDHGGNVRFQRFSLLFGKQKRLFHGKCLCDIMQKRCGADRIRILLGESEHLGHPKAFSVNPKRMLQPLRLLITNEGVSDIL